MLHDASSKYPSSMYGHLLWYVWHVIHHVMLIKIWTRQWWTEIKNGSDFPSRQRLYEALWVVSNPASSTLTFFLKIWTIHQPLKHRLPNSTFNILDLFLVYNLLDFSLYTFFQMKSSLLFQLLDQYLFGNRSPKNYCSWQTNPLPLLTRKWHNEYSPLC